MNCPVCNVTLVMSDKQGVEIDYCPKCRGVWLDRGELDKIIERSAQEMQNPYGSNPSFNKHYDDDDHYKYQRGSGYHHKQKNWLSDLFD